MNDPARRNPWLYNSITSPRGRLRLFCFPPAGGGSSFFRAWFELKLDGIEICPVQLPGREARLEEPPFTRLTPLIQSLAPIIPHDKPFSLFGHSLGALICFELARELRRHGLPSPQHLFLSAAPAPQLPLKPPRHQLPRDDFVRELRNLGGTPEVVLNNSELLAYFMPLLRADFSVADTYEYRAEAPLACPICVFGGESDPEVDYYGLSPWQAQTQNEFRLQMFPGDHFYLQTALTKLMGAISSAVEVPWPV